MLTKDEEDFLAYWTANGLAEKHSARPFVIGLSVGLAIGACVVLALESGWYERANMVANSMLSSVVLVLAIVILSIFMAFIYRRFRWEMQEQRYQELNARKKRLREREEDR